jgi:GTPase SAR1 family protein
MRSLYMKKSQGYLILYSITSKDALQEAEDKILEAVRVHDREVPIVLVE